MDPRKAQQELEAVRRKGAVVTRLKRSLTTPRKIGRVISRAFHDAQAGYGLAPLLAEPNGGVGRLFSGLSERRRDALIATLLPQLEASVKAAWDLLALRPYQVGMTRKPFRAPWAQESLAQVRGRWLIDTTFLLGEYDGDIEWVAAWAPHLAGWTGATDLGWLLAGALELGDGTGDRVFQILIESANGEHPTGGMGRHVTQALMSSSREEGWEFVEKLLLAAQRQEGLRQTILESVDQSHPEAFRRMLHLIREERLSRFSSVVRAFDTWFGFMWDGSSGLKVDAVLERVLLFLEQPEQREVALSETDAETVYLALWTMAFEDVEAAVPRAVPLLTSGPVETRFVAAHFLAQTWWTDALTPLADTALADEDLRVAARAMEPFYQDATRWVDDRLLFERLEALIRRLDKRSVRLESLVWPWWKIKFERSAVAMAMSANASRIPTSRLLPYARDFDPSMRANFLLEVCGLGRLWSLGPRKKKRKPLSSEARGLVLDLVGDPSPEVRRAAFEALEGQPTQADEVERLIGLLSRKAGDLRNACIKRLSLLEDRELVSVVERLLADSSEPRRLAGLELARAGIEAGREEDALRQLAARYGDQRADVAEPERIQLDALLGESVETAQLDDALGLIDPARLRAWPEPRSHDLDLDTAAAQASVDSLAKLALEHRDFEIKDPSGESRLLLEAGYWLPGPRSAKDAGEREQNLPLADVWKAWSAGRGPELRDPDDLELLRGLLALADGPTWSGSNTRELCGSQAWSSQRQGLLTILEWCIYWQRPTGMGEFLLGGFESSLAALSDKDFEKLGSEPAQPWSLISAFTLTRRAAGLTKRMAVAEDWLKRTRWFRDVFPDSWSPADAERLFGLLRWFQKRSRGTRALQLQLPDFVDVYRHGTADENEFIDVLAGRWSQQPGLNLLALTSTRRPPGELAEFPELLEVVDRCRRAIVAVESKRGDRETAASRAALNLRWTGGLETVTQALQALGSTKFARAVNWWGQGESRKDTLSHLVLRSMPRDEDSAEEFADWVRRTRFKEMRLVELAVYAPQWATFVNNVLGWPSLESAVWWLQAHTKDDRSWRLQELKELWAAQVSERTPLSADELAEGAVDVRWFKAVHGQLGSERWAKVHDAAKYASSAGGHKRAQLFASAMLGLTDKAELLAAISQKRHQDSVRALGLLPLADGEAGRADLLDRYSQLQEFRRGSRKFGSQRRASEERAVTIGLSNLARTAGFDDPVRLQWAMEAEAVKDLAAGPVTCVKGETTLRLSIDSEGKPRLEVQKKERKLKSIPAALRKDPEVVELKDRVKELRRQASRVRETLEVSMCRGDHFSANDLRGLAEHPVVAPALSRLVFVADGIAGYPVEAGKALRDQAGQLHAIGHSESLHLAHPHDLLERGDWPSWQGECFRSERVQPFKQVFRELYPLTEAEHGETKTRRYAGHQVGPARALALLRARGWVSHPEEGVHRTFHHAGLTARLYFQEAFFTPADIEGLTLEEVCFTQKGEWKELQLSDIPPPVFSETMRDVDLVVSVAHQGGVDPEASASTTEMRAALVRETCAILGLENVKVEKNHALVTGQLGEYSVHLGSAVSMVLPGRALVIVAVHSQHRGRLFLPFADDDPRTAEVLSKVLLLARDRKIKDPNILEQIRQARR